MPKQLFAREAEAYHRDGAVFPISIMSEAAAGAHRARLEAAEAERGTLHYKVKPYLVFSSAREIALDPVLLDAVEDILGPDILLWDAGYIIKEAHDNHHVSWHQDLTYWGLDSDKLVSAWVALTPATPANGGMRYIPGSHKSGIHAHRDTYSDDNILHRGQEVAGIDEDAALDIVLAPGQVSLHHGWVLHASAPNASADRRIGLSFQFLDPSARQTLTDRESATLVRGQDRYGHFHPEPEWTGDFAPKALAFQKQVEDLKHAVYDGA